MIPLIIVLLLITLWIVTYTGYISEIKKKNKLNEVIQQLQLNYDNAHQRARAAEEDLTKELLRAATQKVFDFTANERAIKDALDKSRSVMRGQATEHLAPLLMEGFNPKDFRFVGNPIDFLVIHGLSDLLDKQTTELPTIYLVDIKTGKSGLTTEQRKIRDAIKQGKIKFGIFNPDRQEFKTFEPYRVDQIPETTVAEETDRQLSFGFPITPGRTKDVG